MEEVWSEISSVEGSFDKLHSSISILQDFLAEPYRVERPSSVSDQSIYLTSSSAAAATAADGPTPPTLLSLNSGPDYQTHHHHHNTHLSSSYLSSSLDGLGSSSSSIFIQSPKKNPREDDDDSSDRRHKRMIKNRESAARSRARRQAYTNELELEVAHLEQENARLRKQQEKLFVADTILQVPKKPTLSRSLTAPF